MSYAALDILNSLSEPDENASEFVASWPQSDADYRDPAKMARYAIARAKPRNNFFPSLDLNCSLGDVRLTAWRDSEHWAIIIETLVFRAQQMDIDNELYLFGNGIRRGTTWDGTNIDRLHIIAESPDGSPFEGGPLNSLRIDAKSILLRDELVNIDLSPSVLEKRQLTVEGDGSKPWPGAVLLRSLLPEHREKLLATENELQRHILRQLPVLIRLDEWHHPNTTQGESPRDNETFQLLARAIAEGDAKLYRPKLSPNTHWKNWPEFGV
jgi:hypothetical protein